MSEKILLNNKEIDITITRLCWELIENHEDFSETVIIGMQPRGIFLAEKIVTKLNELKKIDTLHWGSLDSTFFRDDFRHRNEHLLVHQTNIDFLIEGKRVVFIDDVLYTGRSIRAALNAVGSFGRPKDIELLVLINRRFSRELPISPNYVGKEVDAISTEKVKVEWSILGKEDKVSLINN